MRKGIIPVLALVGSLVGANARAHEGGVHSRGTVKEVTADRLVLLTADGKSVSVAMDAQTRIVRGDRTISPAQVRPGERAVVHSVNHDGKLAATEVMVADAPR